MDTVNPLAPPPPVSTQTMIRSQIVHDAQDLPDLIEKAKDADPALAASLTEKSLLGSKTVWFPMISWGVTAAASKYGLGWDDATAAEVASLLSWLVSIGVRYVTRSPIGSILPK